MKELASERVEEILRGLYRNTSFSRNQAPMLSHYLASHPTVVERVSNHLSPSPTAEIEKAANRYTRNCDACTAGSGGRRNQELVTENDAYKMDPLWADLNELA